MARPLKDGCNYFPSDVNIYSDFKIMDLLNEYGPMGYVVYDWILRRVYQEGYYLETDLNQLSSYFIRDIGSKWVRNKSIVEQVIHYCAELDLFDRDLLAQGVITSVGIQRRYLEITSRRKRKNRLEKYRILQDTFSSACIIEDNVNNNSENADDNSINDNSNAVKKRKEKESNTGTDESAPAVVQLILNDNSMYPIYQKQIEEWHKLFPAVDIVIELRKMQAWLSANPKRRKTKKGILRFVVNWLMKEQDKPHHREVTGKSEYPNL